MFSTPPAMNTSPSPALIAWAALAAACSPEPHSRFTVCPGTSTGRPARSSAIRATLRLSSPAWLVQPRITSSIARGSIPVRSTTALIGTAARSSARTCASAPPCFPTGVRSAAQMYASRSTIPLLTASSRLLPPSQCHPHGLHLGVALQGFFPEIPPEPGKFVTAERRRGVVEVVAVHPHGSGLDRARDAVRLLDIPGPHPGCEAVHGPVREPDPLCLVIEGQHSQHGPEDLLVHDLHPGPRPVEHRRLDEVPFAVHLGRVAPRHERRAFLLSGCDIGKDLLLLALGDERPETGVLVEGVTRGEFLRPLGELFNHLVVDGFLDQEPRPGRAHLALPVTDPGLSAAHGGREVRVGEDDVDRKSTRLNSSHTVISYAVFCLKKKKRIKNERHEIKTLIAEVTK